MNLPRMRFALICLTAMAVLSGNCLAQSVLVTLKLEASQIQIGESTTLHVYAQVASALRVKADRIFSWNVDLLDAISASADASGSISKSAADKDPQLSSNGNLDGVNRRSISDTFLNLPGAGVSAPVELFAISVKGLAQGSITFHVQAGTGASGLGADFIVAPIGGGDPLLGTDYSQANATLIVGAGGCQSRLAAAVASPINGSNRIAIGFTLCPGLNHTVEFTDDLLLPNWQALSGAPHNSGMVTEPTTNSHRFYRVRLTSAPGM